MKEHCTGIILAAGQGRRMGAGVQKQYMELEGKPLLYYSLKMFERSAVISDIVLVVGKGQEEFVRAEIVERYHITKVCKIVSGGAERYDSVWQGLKAANAMKTEGYVFIHDGARPFVDEEILERGYETVQRYQACVAGMPSKDTVKTVDESQFAKETPERKYVWLVQTPQVFEKPLIMQAYSRLMKEENINVTDDAMVVEQMMKIPVKLFEGSYENIKVTTPEDMEIATVLLGKRLKKVRFGIDL